mmetsp:Transcript_16299/g.26523  ORF Transcript_16299/g.26523 Transcript_16299/m.26523 type:complete len:90 (+) Transcript_16299:1120-1389(+)
MAKRVSRPSAADPTGNEDEEEEENLMVGFSTSAKEANAFTIVGYRNTVVCFMSFLKGSNSGVLEYSIDAPQANRPQFTTLIGKETRRQK